MKQQGILLFTWMWWLFGGVRLLLKGMELAPEGEMGTLFLIGAVLGMIKYTLVLRNSAAKIVQYVIHLSLRKNLFQIYPVRLYIVLAMMVGMMVFLRQIGLSERYRAVIDLGVGIALISSGTEFLRAALFLKSYLRS